MEKWNPEVKQYTGREIDKRVNRILKFNFNDFGQEEVIQEKGLLVILLGYGVRPPEFATRVFSSGL